VLRAVDHATQVALTRRIFGFLDGRTTELGDRSHRNAVTAYTSPTRLEQEHARLFGHEPLLVGLAGDLATPGAYLVHAAGGVPILVLRSAGGALRAFLGLCRHRGAPVASGCGVGPGRFTCPYHGWTYDEAGALIAQPCAEGFADLDRSTLGLAPLPVAERHGLVFARAAPGPPIDVDAHLAGAEAELAPLGLGGYVPFARREVTHDLNWKLAIDTFLEAYHVSHLHSGTLGPGILGHAAAWDAFGRGGRLVATRRSIDTLRDRAEAEWNLLEHAVVLYLLFPNTMLIHQIDHVEVVQSHPSGRSPDRSTVTFALYTPAPVASDRARRHFQNNFDLLVDVVEREDFALAARMQRGFHADAGATVVYGRNEPGLAHYHRALDAALTSAADSGP
jgi:phenylpropionate dioxygenase-like ring-hydroxylating dioxygenase large terminal subunit